MELGNCSIMLPWEDMTTRKDKLDKKKWPKCTNEMAEQSFVFTKAASKIIDDQ